MAVVAIRGDGTVSALRPVAMMFPEAPALPLPTLPGRFLPSGDDIGEQLEGGGGTIDAPPVERRASNATTAVRR